MPWMARRPREWKEKKWKKDQNNNVNQAGKGSKGGGGPKGGWGNEEEGPTRGSGSFFLVEVRPPPGTAFRVYFFGQIPTPPLIGKAGRPAGKWR